MSADPPVFHRTANPNRLWGEVRAKVPVEVLAVIDGACAADAEARGRSKTREEKVKEILREWAVRKQREATLIVNASNGNPQLAESDEED